MFYYESPAQSHRSLGVYCLGYGNKRERNCCGPRKINSYGFIYIEQGQGWLETSATSGRITLTKGSLFWLLPGISHTYTPDENGWHERWTLFDGPLVNAAQQAGFFSPQHPLIHGCHLSAIPQLYTLLEHDFRIGHPLVSVHAGSLVYQMIIEAHCLASGIIVRHNEQRSIVATIITYLEEHACVDIDYYALAERVGVGYSTMRRHFKDATGSAPKEFVLRLRLRRAKELLVTTAASIGEIAQHCGFNDAYYFSRLFHMKEGLTPSQFRTEQQFELSVLST